MIIMNDSAQTWHKQAMAVKLDERSVNLRQQVIKTLESGQRGHLGASLSLIEIIRVLYDEILTYDSDCPNLPTRDRFILSKGHGCIALYVMLAEKGFFTASHLENFCKHKALLGGHPDSTKIPGVEASTGSLGHGLSIGVGMAINAKFEKTNSRVFVTLGDGECNEGSVWEAAMNAAKHRLDNLNVLIDYNKYQSYDETSIVQDLEPFPDKWKSFGFATTNVNGHDVADLKAQLSKTPIEQDKPTAFICHTVKGKGVSFAENNLVWHHKSKIDSEMADSLYDSLGV